MSDLDKKPDHFHPVDVSLTRKNAPGMIIADLPNFKLTPEQVATKYGLSEVMKIYREHGGSHVLDIRVTPECFESLNGRPGFQGGEYNRLVEIKTTEGVEHHVITSPYTNVSEMRKSGSKKVELVPVARGANRFEGEEIRIELATVTAEEVGEIEDRTDIPVESIIKLSLVSADVAAEWIKVKTATD